MSSRAAAAALTGAAIGLAWGTSLRAWMTHLAIEFDTWPVYTWEGTFLSALLPAALIGALIGLDWHRRTVSTHRVPMVMWSPLLLVVGPALIAEDFIGTLMTTGEGSGAISFVLIGMAGGFAASGRGPGWMRVGVAGLVAVGVTAVMAFMLYFHDQNVTPSRTFGAVHLVVLLVWLAIGCSIAMRQVKGARADNPNSSDMQNLAGAES